MGSNKYRTNLPSNAAGMLAALSGSFTVIQSFKAILADHISRYSFMTFLTSSSGRLAGRCNLYTPTIPKLTPIDCPLHESTLILLHKGYLGNCVPCVDFDATLQASNI